MMLLLKGTTHYSVLKTSISYVKIWWDGQIIYWGKKKQVVSHSYRQYKSDVSLFHFPS